MRQAWSSAILKKISSTESEPDLRPDHFRATNDFVEADRR
jgi:hypothetical protein